MVNSQEFLNAFTDLCPCGSGRLLIDCCSTMRFNTIPPGTQTGYSNPHCYARILNDCSNEMSKEHFVSKSVLSIIEDSGKQMTISGPHWLAGGQNKKISVYSLASKVLCTRHNAALSNIDEIGKLFFQFIMGVNVTREVLMINGFELERWMLKLLCGYISSGNISPKFKQWQPSNQWLQILFGREDVPIGSGMYILRGRDIKTSYNQILVWVIENDRKDNLNGLFFQIFGFQFLFFMGLPRWDIPQRIYKSGWQMRYRPECLVIVNYSKQREVHFGPPPRGGYVVMKTSLPGNKSSNNSEIAK